MSLSLELQAQSRLHHNFGVKIQCVLNAAFITIRYLTLRVTVPNGLVSNTLSHSLWRTLLYRYWATVYLAERNNHIDNWSVTCPLSLSLASHFLVSPRALWWSSTWHSLRWFRHTWSSLAGDVDAFWRTPRYTPRPISHLAPILANGKCGFSLNCLLRGGKIFTEFQLALIIVSTTFASYNVEDS